MCAYWTNIKCYWMKDSLHRCFWALILFQWMSLNYDDNEETEQTIQVNGAIVDLINF